MAALAPVHAGTASQEARPTPPDSRAWIDLVETHVAGSKDLPVLHAATWSLADLFDAVDDLSRSGRPDLVRVFSRGLILHTDVAVHFRTNTGYGLASGLESMSIVTDGRTVGESARTVHWELGREIVRRIPDARDRVRIGRLWYRASAAWLQQWGEYPELRLHLDAANDLLEDDPVLLLYEGAVHQTYARPLVQRALDEPRQASQIDWLRAAAATSMATLQSYSRTRDQQRPGLPLDAEGERRLSERLFRRALAADSNLVEARIRLAEVLGDRGEHEDARRELARALAAPLPVLLEYYASLMHGREAQRAGDLDVARRALQRALVLYPNAQAPRIGLSHLAASRGDFEAARAAISPLASRPDAAIDEDPWFWIDRVHEPSASVLLAEMRAVLAQ
jgi:Tfp pilus assembly protein PilF